MAAPVQKYTELIVAGTALVTGGIGLVKGNESLTELSAYGTGFLIVVVGYNLYVVIRKLTPAAKPKLNGAIEAA